MVALTFRTLFIYGLVLVAHGFDPDPNVDSNIQNAQSELAAKENVLGNVVVPNDGILHEKRFDNLDAVVGNKYETDDGKGNIQKHGYFQELDEESKVPKFEQKPANFLGVPNDFEEKQLKQDTNVADPLADKQNTQNLEDFGIQNNAVESQRNKAVDVDQNMNQNGARNYEQNNADDQNINAGPPDPVVKAPSQDTLINKLRNGKSVIQQNFEAVSPVKSSIKTGAQHQNEQDELRVLKEGAELNKQDLERVKLMIEEKLSKMKGSDHPKNLRDAPVQKDFNVDSNKGFLNENEQLPDNEKKNNKDFYQNNLSSKADIPVEREKGKSLKFEPLNQPNNGVKRDRNSNDLFNVDLKPKDLLSQKTGSKYETLIKPENDNDIKSFRGKSVLLPLDRNIVKKEMGVADPKNDVLNDNRIESLLDANIAEQKIDGIETKKVAHNVNTAQSGGKDKFNDVHYDNNETPNEIPKFLDQYDTEKEKYDKQHGSKHNVLSTIDNHLVVQESQNGIQPEQNANSKESVHSDVFQKPIEEPKVSQDDVNEDTKKYEYKFKFGKTGAKKADSYDKSYVYKNTTPKPTPKPTPKTRPEASMRRDVAWFPEYHSYSLKASVDMRFRIRYAPIPADGSPWPMPQTYTPEKIQYGVDPFGFMFHSAGESCDILDYAMERVRRNMFGDIVETEPERSSGMNNSPPGDYILRLVNVTVLRECDVFPHLDMDESYDLEVRQSGVVIIAREVWGAIRGLETFSQLVYQDTGGMFVVNKTLIHDFPRFKHRGILLDTSRHYLSKDTILLNLEAMAQNKMNVLHWHIVDEQSFPFVSNSYPNLTKQGAYDPVTHVYTHDVIREIINEARVRGIRVIPEFDTPGHTFAWGLGQDNLLTPCYDYSGKPDGYFGPINPILKSTYHFLDGLFREVMGLFKDKYVHLGGDEVSLDCWNTNPYLQRFMKRNNLYDVKDLLNVYTKKLVDIIADIGQSREQGSGYIVWQEVFDDGVKLKKDAIVQIWKGNAWDIDRVTSKGLRALFSSCWYLDYISYGQDWDKYYLCNQVLGDLDIYNVRNQSLLMGGDVCMWAEFADDENILPRIWPRASAAAERLWSAKTVVDMQAAAPRIEEHRCRMKRRGIPTGVLSGPGYCRKYTRPGSKKSSSLDNTFISKFFTWDTQFAEDPPVKHKSLGPFKNEYNVDMNSMYVVPLVIIVCVVCLTILATVQDTSKHRLLALITLPVKSTTKRGFRGLLYVFMVFALVWCIWTAPLWMHAWETSSPAAASKLAGPKSGIGSRNDGS